MKMTMIICRLILMSGLLMAPMGQANTNQALIELLKALQENGTINTDSNLRAVAEAAYAHGPLSLQGEYYYVDIDRDAAASSDLDFSGYYV